MHYFSTCWHQNMCLRSLYACFKWGTFKESLRERRRRESTQIYARVILFYAILWHEQAELLIFTLSSLLLLLHSYPNCFDRMRKTVFAHNMLCAFSYRRVTKWFERITYVLWWELTLLKGKLVYFQCRCLQFSSL